MLQDLKNIKKIILILFAFIIIRIYLCDKYHKTTGIDINTKNKTKTLMKHFLYLFLLATLCSCTTEVLSNSDLQVPEQIANSTFSFEAITEPSNWARYQSLEEMMDACQIPEGQLKAMTTQQLIMACISHPLRLNYVCYNNELNGAEVIIKNFNGFKELKSRKDGAEQLINFYETINLDVQAKDKFGTDYGSEAYNGFLELILASKYMPEVFEGANRNRIETIADQVLQKKLSQSDRSMFGIRHTMLVGAQAKLAKTNLEAEERQTLSNYVNASGMMPDDESYTKVSLILAK